jgi:polysaccharide biosynthesis/export protein ExoF
MRSLLTALALLGTVWSLPVEAEDYTLDTGDTLRLHVHEWPDVSGRFTVDAIGQINLPMAGRINARGASVTEATELIQAALDARMQTQAGLNLTVDIETYRPFYVLGTVDAGAFEYRPGLTVLQAVALAGGPLRPTDLAGARTERDAITARGDMLLARSQRDVLRVRLARLEGELNGADDFALPEGVDVDDPVVADAVRVERLAFERRRGVLVGSIKHLQEMVVLYEEERASIEAQIESREEQIALIEVDYEVARSLVERGLATSQRETGVRQELAIAITLRRDLDTRIVQLRQNIAEATREIAALSEEFSREAIEDLRGVKAEILIAEAQYATAMHLMAEAQSFETRVRADTRTGQGGLRYYIQRTGPESTQELEAAETTPVRPGDVVIVERSLRR